MEAYQTIIGEKIANSYSDPLEYVNNSYQNNITDEFILPALNNNYSSKELTIQDNDAIIFANFRPDRARQLSHLIFGSDYYNFQPELRRKNIFLVTMMTYEGIKPSMVAYPPIVLPNVFGKTLSDQKISQLRIAETEKYAHVTFFFDGGKEIDYPLEKKILIPSPKIATYDLQPEMSAKLITDALLEDMENYQVIVLNFANGDMVGHTGNYQATIKAIETIDEQIGRIYKQALKTNTTLFITADHGNAEMMFDKDRKPITKHTINPVIFLITDKSCQLKNKGKLANIAPTILDYLNLKKPNEMDEESLIIKSFK